MIAIGAWLTIFAVAFEPSIQQALRFTNDFRSTISNGNQIAEISSASSWGGGRLEGDSAQRIFPLPYRSLKALLTFRQVVLQGDGSIGQYIAVDLDFSMISAMYNGLDATPEQILQQTPFTCSSGRCKWEPYLSLAVCSACYDVRDQVSARQAKVSDGVRVFDYYWTDFDGEYSPNNFTGTVFMLPNHLAIWNLPGFSDQALMTTRTTSRWSESLHFKKNNTLIFAISMLQLPPSWTESAGSSQLSARECGLYFCVKSYESEVAGGTLNERSMEVSSTMDPSSFQILPNISTTADGRIPPDVLYDQDTYYARTPIRVLPPNANASAFNADQLTISQAGVAALVTQAQTMFNYSNVSPNLPLNISIGGGARRTSKFGNVFSPPSIQTLYNSANIDQSFANLANAMTNDMRRSGIATQVLKGEVSLPVTKVHIRWGWVAFSAVLIVVGTLFLLISILLTKRTVVPLWKTNALALLFHQLHPAPQVDQPHMPTVGEMENMVRDISAKLGNNETLEVRPIIRKRKQTKRNAQNRGASGAHFGGLLPASLADQDVEQTNEPSNASNQHFSIARKAVPTSRTALIQ